MYYMGMTYISHLLSISILEGFSHYMVNMTAQYMHDVIEIINLLVKVGVQMFIWL